MAMHDQPVKGTQDHWFTHRVSYGETDTMGVLYYGEYFHIFERGRSDFIRGLGLSYAQVEERGLFLPVRDAQCRYRAPARYDDLLQIRLYLSAIGRASLVFGYALYDEARECLMATGTTQHACVDKSGKPIAVPQWFSDICFGRGLG